LRPSAFYLIGVAALGLAYYPMKDQVPPIFLLGAIVAYLIALRFIAVRFGKTEAAETVDADELE
jgi:hypothetical protein